MAEKRLTAAQETEIRVGQGYDVHAFGPGDAVTLGGVRIPHDSALMGHSDADVALHALTDAVLGAIAAGDIGSHFPPSDPQWRGASSDRFLAHAIGLLRARGGSPVNLDLTILAEAPRIGPHRDAMRARIAAICGVDTGSVAVKATTNEGLGFVGRREGIAALATATVRLPMPAE
jgi:2-C-methyl-D-erythritol 4-phosphate cytidylyltransferase/2-C-methyl-D-erythritol 2,4-cyclodiphosphate synthase